MTEIIRKEPGSIHFLAGAGAGMIADSVVHPVDTVRARLQTGKTDVGTFRTFSQILTKEGWRALYRGFGIVVAFTTPAHALYFLGYEFGKKFLSPKTPIENKSSLVHFTSGVFAECLGSLIWTPMDVVKQRLQVKSVHNNELQYRNSFHGIVTILKQEGLIGLYRGLGASIATYAPFVGIYFVCYEKSKKIIWKIIEKRSRKITCLFTLNFWICSWSSWSSSNLSIGCNKNKNSSTNKKRRWLC